MRTFGMSAAVVCALAAPAWGSDPLPSSEDGPPAPAGYSLISPELVPAGFGLAPDALPPLMPPPTAPVPGVLPGAPAAGDPCCYPFDPCAGHQRRKRHTVVHNECWVRGDWLYWDLRDTPIPPLIVSGNPVLPLAGIPGGGNSVPLVGGPRDVGRFNGARLALGRWFDPDGEFGVEFTGFVLGREGSTDLFAGGPGRTVSVPFLGTNGAPGVYDFSFPGRFTGTVGVLTSTQLFGAEATMLHRVYGDGCLSVDALLGYRYLQLNERLDLLGLQRSAGTTGTFVGSTLPAGAVVTTVDSFRARTEFHGGQIGTRVEGRRGMFTVSSFGKVGVGANVQTLRVDGVSRTGFGVSRAALGGVRALGTNFGRDTNTEFSFISETGIELGLQMTKSLSLRVGYNLLFWSDVLRPGNVIDPVLSQTQVPIDPTFNAAVPATRPTTVFRSSDFLAHGLVVGAMMEW